MKLLTGKPGLERCKCGADVMTWRDGDILTWLFHYAPYPIVCDGGK